MSNRIRIGKRMVGDDQPTYFVADVAANHDGELERAKELIFLCAEAGADAAKFQNFFAETIVSDYGFRKMGSQSSHQATWKKSVFEVYKDASIPMEWTQTLKRACDEAGIDYFTSPYDLGIIDRLSEYVCAWKLGSGDITWHAMIERLARSGKPLLMATGASNMDEVRLAVDVARKSAHDLVLMQCNTNYTASLDNFRHIALNVLQAYAREFPDLVLGLSDHTPGCATVLGAVALGARVVEKHFTDDTFRIGPDHKFSMDPASWRDMVDRTRELEAALGSEEKRVMDNELETVVLQRRAVRAARELKKGQAVSEADLTVLRPCPAGALPPYRLSEVLGRNVRRDIEAGDVVSPEDFE
ncbi:MAG: N-acetylneuraminate synthase family protein [Thermodesulfobacteriota bacterium]|nr:N-acetylneuraminate synthase family protein [Thermodesulfobacteriota bacterium]